MLGEIIEQECGSRGSTPKPWSMVMPIRPAGDLPPLFCIHGGDGGVFFYRDLAEHLPPGRPLFAIEAPALAIDGAVQPVSIEDTAATYLAELRQYQNKGPFHLIGYSYGGLVVYEIARQLIGEGETVAFAGMVDTINPATAIRRYSLTERIRIFWKSRAHLGFPRKICKMIARAREGVATHIRVRKELHSSRNAGITEPHSRFRMLQVREAHWSSMQVYQPGTLACQITLFKSRETDDKFQIPDDYGWSRLVSSLDIVEVGGEHLEMFAKEHITELAGKINARLA
jgi:thioesterase domain-containing protein